MNTFENGWAYIHQATKMGYTKTVEKVMRSQGELLELETQDGMRETPLHVAVKYKESNIDTVKVLVELGANVTAVNAQNHGVVELACLTFNVAAIKYFVSLESPDLPVWRRMLAFIRSDLEDESQRAGACIRELTRPLDGSATNPNWRPLCDGGGVPVLVGVVKGAAGDLAVAQALHCLINVAERPEVKQQTVAAGGLAAFVKHLRSTPAAAASSLTVVELAATALRLVCDVGEYADQACAQGALPALVAVLRAHGQPSAPASAAGRDVLVAAVLAIGVLTDGSDERQSQFNGTPDGVDSLCALFHDCTHQPLLLALNQAVGKVVRRHRANQDAIVSGGALELVVMLCDVKHREIQLSAVRAVHALVEGNAAAQRALRGEGAVMPLLGLLRKSGSQEVLETTAGALWALAGDDHEDRRAMAAVLSIPTLIEFIGSLSETLHFVGSEGLGVLAQGACNRQGAIADANGVHPLIRILKSDKEYLVLSAVRSMRHMCVGVGFVPHRRNQNTVAQSRGIRLLIALLSLSKSELIRVEAALTLASVALGNQEVVGEMWQPSQYLEFGYALVLRLLYSKDDEVRLLAGAALATFAYNSMAQQQAIAAEGGVRFACFVPFLQSDNEFYRCNGAFQAVVLSRIVPDEEPALSSAAGIQLIVDILHESKSHIIQALAADCVARLCHTRAGIPAAFVTIGAVDRLCNLMLSTVEQVRGCAAIALAYLSYNHAAERQLLNRCRTDPYLIKCLYFYAEKSNVSPKFIEEWGHYKKVGLPPIPEGRPTLVNNQNFNPYVTVNRNTIAQNDDSVKQSASQSNSLGGAAVEEGPAASRSDDGGAGGGGGRLSQSSRVSFKTATAGPSVPASQESRRSMISASAAAAAD